ncbi:MAG: hypothetical protein JW720_12515 [Sedimentisphaerales bacterium]|nr:hypothetical protein [Sedimentisphaerales bacterium]
MNKAVILTLVLSMAGGFLLSGCHSGPSDEELIGMTMAEWKTAVAAKDIDKVMAEYSESYSSERGDGKEQVRQFMTTVFERGWMDSATIELEEAQAAIEGDKATFGPVKFKSDRGEFAINYDLKKEDGVWLIAGSRRQEQ